MQKARNLNPLKGKVGSHKKSSYCLTAKETNGIIIDKVYVKVVATVSEEKSPENLC